ncbi:glycosyltransferase family 2 protein [Helicobacter sp.]|uniref:glycosyltransferase family A protein n=1 Tax=Helicobacter sp. TaxID=218 RepID=UPI0019B60002|nr:glycosyltransferase family 2 protein [Helicobacter sp.]MBD5165662.1 glycosyltransferase family 2 protein [Helicobacter sp.]
MSQTKKVGIIVPIYNVEKYLRQCLESIIHQTYKSLEILLINDGSTDSSLRIAKEYAQKDSRIIIIDKENGGQASARNVGIEFLSGEIFYRCKVADCHSENKARNDEEEATLHSYKIIGENPYQIHAIYSLKSLLEIPTIDYLQFVDSDDYIELDCVEQCVPRMRDIDILWFDAKTFLDGVKKSDWKSNLYHFSYTQEVILSKKDWAIRLFERKLYWFYYAWQGMINFHFLTNTKLRFLNGIIQEDDMFGILLFAQSNHIYVYPKKLYHYRIRANSTMNYDNNLQTKVAGFFAKNTEAFKDNYSKRAYHKASSFMQTALSIDTFLQNSQDERVKHIISKYLMPTYTFYAHKILYFSQDPLNLIPEFQKLQKYLEDLNFHLFADGFLKDELIYKLGSVSLNLLKNPKRIVSLPNTLRKMIHNAKEAQKAYQANVTKYQLNLPNFRKLVNNSKELKTRRHLSYKLGDCILKAHKMRYFGGYLWLPFGAAFNLINFKPYKQKKDSILLNSMNRLINEVSHLNWQIWSKDIGNHSSDFFTKLQSLGISVEFQDIFIQMLEGGKLVMSYTKDKKWLDLLIECKAQIHYFEPNPAIFKFYKEKYQESNNVIFYPNALSNVEQVQIQARDNRGNGIHPSIYYASDNTYEAKSLSISEVLQKFSNLYLLILELDFETCVILEELIKSKEYLKISYIFCKVNAIFAESQKFKSLKQIIDSTPPPDNILYFVKEMKDEQNTEFYYKTGNIESERYKTISLRTI